MNARHTNRIATAALAFFASAAFGQLSSTEIQVMQMEGQEEGWTFTVNQNAATYRDLQVLCTLVPPAEGQVEERVNPLLTARDAIVGLPAAFDWREQDGCTPIRNQASCGSCWAFGTVGVMECAMLIDSGIARDLSEQYLVSCNSSGYSCNGGWWAHDYHYDRVGRDGGGIGAVLETAKPYTATNGTCSGALSHPHALNNWYYITNSYSVPTTDAIKQAILSYGPVAVAVTVNSAFQAYSSGVFNSSSTAAVNHAVILVGWDDADQAWILRNSWGTNWGESGYMRIRYGCSKIGYGATYVDYGSGTVLGATLVSPEDSTTLTSASVTFTWDAYEGAEEYWLGIGTNANKPTLYSASQGTATSVTVSNLPVTGVKLYAKLFTKIDGQWYGRMSMYTAANLPAAGATMTSPANGSTLASSTATFQWTTGDRVTQYKLWIGTTSGGYNLYNKALGKATSVTVSNLPAGGRTLYVRLFSYAGGVWYTANYTYHAAAASPAAATMTSPTNGSTLESSQTTFTWTEGLGATEYRLQIGTTLDGRNVCNLATKANRTATIANIPTAGDTLHVKLWSLVNGVWQSNSYTYTAPTATKVIAEMTSPAPSSTLESNIVTFTWSQGVGVTQYRLDVSTVREAGNIYNKAQKLSRSVTLNNLPMNGATVYVRLWSLVSGVWQKNEYTYTAVTAAAAAATMVDPAPGSTLTSSLVTFEWTAGTGATEYWLRVGKTLGGIEYHNKTAGLNTYATVAGLPRDRSTIRVRVLTKINGLWQQRDYTYTAAAPDAAHPFNP